MGSPKKGKQNMELWKERETTRLMGMEWDSRGKKVNRGWIK